MVTNLNTAVYTGQQAVDGADWPCDGARGDSASGGRTPSCSRRGLPDLDAPPQPLPPRPRLFALAPVFPARSVPLSPGFPSSASSADSGTRSLFVAPSDKACEPFLSVSASSGSDSYGTPSPARVSDSAYTFVYPFCVVRSLLKKLKIAKFNLHFCHFQPLIFRL